MSDRHRHGTVLMGKPSRLCWDEQVGMMRGDRRMYGVIGYETYRLRLQLVKILASVTLIICAYW